MIAAWIISYFLVGAVFFFIFHRFIRDGYDNDEDAIGVIILFLWPAGLIALAIVVTVKEVVAIGRRIKGE